MALGLPMPAWVADASAEHPTVATLRAAGAVGIVRYMDPGRNDGTEITAAEIADYHANGFPYALVCEYSADWLEGGYNVGHSAALAALPEEAKLGIPHGVMYLACDFQIEPPQYAPALAAMQGFADAYGGRVYVRPYGSKAFCEWVEAQWGFQGCWSTDAWSDFQTANGSVLHQHASPPPGTPAGCDYNDVLGDWAPRNASTDWFDMATPADLAAVVDASIAKALNAGTAPGQQNWASTNKALLTTLQGVVNTLRTIVGSQAVVIAGGNGHQGLDQLHAAIGTVETAMGQMSGGTVDPTAIATAVAAEVKTIIWKAS